MPSVTVKLYSVFFKFLLKHRLQSRIQAASSGAGGGNPFGVTSRPDEESIAAANPSFGADGVATKDIHIDPLTSLSLRIFLADSCLAGGGAGAAGNGVGYRGYAPGAGGTKKRMPIVLQFHGGGFVSGSNDTAANDFFCRRVAKMCDVIVIAVGYRLAPESRYPAAFEDGLKVLSWLGKQANLAECGKSMTGNVRVGGGGGGGGESRKTFVVDAFGASMVEPWLAAHGDPSRCVLLGASCGANIADYVTRKAVEAGKLLDPVKVVAQVLMCPFFIGSVPTHSEIKLANSYFYDKAMCILAWKLFLPEEEFDLDHPAANPLVPARGPPLKLMPPTLTVVAEHDWMRDRAIAYAAELRKAKVDAPVLEYKDAVHDFASLEILFKSPQAQACAEDLDIWMKKYISIRGHEFSY